MVERKGREGRFYEHNAREVVYSKITEQRQGRRDHAGQKNEYACQNNAMFGPLHD